VIVMPDWPGWDSLSAVSRIHSWAEVTGIVLLGLLVLAEAITWKYSGRRDFLAEQQQTAEKQRHDDEMARVHLETAKANERTAELNTTLEKERSARLAMLDQLKPRDITRKQMATIADALRGHIGTVYLYPLADPEASRYLYAISETLKAAGADAKLMFVRDEKSGLPIYPEKFDAPVSIVGVTAYESPSAGPGGFVDTTIRAFASAGISIGGQSSETPFPNVQLPAIFIGRKLEPFGQVPAYAMRPELEEWLREHPPPWAGRK
jgi:hypothetical protein